MASDKPTEMQHDELIIDSGLGYLTVAERDHLSFVVDSMTRRGVEWKNGRTCAFLSLVQEMIEQQKEPHRVE